MLLALVLPANLTTVSYFQNKTTRDDEESHYSTCNADGTVHQTQKTNYSYSEFKVLYVQLKVYVFGDDGLP